MQNKSDAQLLGDYAGHRSESAFAEIVARHTGLVYSAAYRQTGSAELAREIAQSVFTDLASKARELAATLSADASLAGWLFRSTRFAGLKLLRDEHRRQTRERQFMEHFNSAPESGPDWERVAPVLDEAMAELDDADHEAVLLRYFKNQDFHTVGLALGVSDAAAQKRVSRAVERLRDFFSKRGITIGAGGLVVVISANAVQGAPIGLAAALSATALASATAAGATASSLFLTHFFSSARFKFSAAALTVAGLVAILFLQYQTNQRLEVENRALQQQVAAAQRLAEQAEMTRLAAMKASQGALEQAQEELPRLRGEVVRLRNQNAAARTQTGLATTSADLLTPALSKAQFTALLTKLDTVPLRVIRTRLGETINYPKTGSDINAEKAVRALGASVLPHLFEFLRTDDTNAIANSKIPFAKTGRFQRWLAVKAFYALGADAAPAIPALLNFGPINGPDDDAAYALAGIGPAAVNPLTEALSSTDNAVRRRAILALGFIGPEASSASTTLIRCLANTQEASDLRGAALFALKETAPDSEQALPVLLEAFRDPNLFRMTDSSIHRFCTAFEHYGPRAKAAFPGLLELLPNVHPRQVSLVKRALKAVDAQAAAEAGIE